MSAPVHPLAVVTAASSGMGFELARQFADDGFDVVVAAEDAGISDAATKLAACGVTVTPVQVDLAQPEHVVRLYHVVHALGRPVDAIALNAGIGAGDAFATDTDLDKELRIVDLNVRSTLHLAKLVVADMVRRN